MSLHFNRLALRRRPVLVWGAFLGAIANLTFGG